MTSPRFPEPPPSQPPTPLPEIDRKLERLHAKKDAWLQVSIPQRIAFLEAAQKALMKESDGWARAISAVKGISVDDPLHGEDWLAGPMTLARNIRLLIESLRAGGQPRPPSLRQRGDQWIAEVMPASLDERLLFTGWRAEVWLQPGKPPSQGRIYREKQTEGKVALVLGAGNVASIAPMDVLYKLFAENEVVLVKMNPVNEAGGPFLERVFAALIDAGFLAFVYGGSEVGRHVTDHALTHTLHMTGSDRTHDAIVWGGSPEEQAANKAAGKRRLNKPFSSELGNVTPVLVVPGPWSDADLEHQAWQVAGMVTQNASFNCAAAKAVITARNWELRERFLKKLENALANSPSRKAYYPGAESRFEGFLNKYPSAKVLGARGPQIVPWTLIPDVPLEKGEYALTNEAFCGVLSESSVDAKDAAEFLTKAVPLVNENVWGTLNAMLLVHPETQKQLGPAFEQFIADMRYGCITVNGWTGAGYGLGHTTWGAFPGHTDEDIQSGRGVVHNTYLFDYPERSVLYLPFRLKPTPLWHPRHKNLAALGRRLTAFEASPSALKLAAIIPEALRG